MITKIKNVIKVEVGDLIKHRGYISLVVYDCYHEKIRLIDLVDCHTTYTFDNIDELRAEKLEMIAKASELKLTIIEKK